MVSLRNKGILNKSGKRMVTVGEKRLLLAGFRLATLSLSLIELAFDIPESSYLPGILVPIGATLYTFFKLAHPLRWYMSRLPAIALTVADIMVCAALIFIYRQIHTPFTLYSLNPVLTAALLFSPRVTLITAGVTAMYYTSIFAMHAPPDPLQHLSSMFFIYVAALGATAWLPYVVNTDIQRSLQSSVISQERLRLGRELHDGPCQKIYSLRWQLQMLRRDVGGIEWLAEKLEHLERVADEAEQEVRGSIELLRSFRQDRPLLSQLDDSLRHLKSENGIVYRLEATGGEPRLDGLVKLEVLHICEEALRNVAKHSGARQLAIRVNDAPNGRLRVSVADDGRGVAGAGRATGHGLKVMRERAESLGGSFEVVSVPGSGTEIRVEVPRKWTQEL